MFIFYYYNIYFFLHPRIAARELRIILICGINFLFRAQFSYLDSPKDCAMWTKKMLSYSEVAVARAL